jgi:tripartite-type tricarboxylate transporter receptor subunit TctC
MKLPRRRFLRLTAGTAALPVFSCRIIVGFQAGTASDIIARLIAQWFNKSSSHRSRRIVFSAL